MDDADYPFNDEFLFTEEDRKTARERFGKIYPALDHDELRTLFAPFDKDANDAKTASRWFGFSAVGCVTAAFLVATAGEAFWGDDRFVLWVICGVSVVFSVGGILLGAFGVLFANRKEKWLVNRFLTERLRQFHFQFLIAFAPDIVEAAESGQWDAFNAKRANQLALFKKRVVERRLPIIDTLLTDYNHDAWLFPYSEPTLAPGEAATQLFDAYQMLRIERQIRFAEYKLMKRRRSFSRFPRVQAAWLTGIAMACVFGLVLLHVLIFVSVRYWPAPEKYLSVAAVAAAILALAARTLEEGLRPGPEIERYRAYRSALKSIERRYNEGAAQSDKFKAMASLETLSYNEMVNFLKSNYEAHFVM